MTSELDNAEQLVSADGVVAKEKNIFDQPFFDNVIETMSTRYQNLLGTDDEGSVLLLRKCIVEITKNFTALKDGGGRKSDLDGRRIEEYFEVLSSKDKSEDEKKDARYNIFTFGWYRNLQIRGLIGNRIEVKKTFWYDLVNELGKAVEYLDGVGAFGQGSPYTLDGNPKKTRHQFTVSTLETWREQGSLKTKLDG